MATRILLLDVDGVLNCHDQFDNKYCCMHEDKLDLLDSIVRRTGCHIVLVSAWRYLILSGKMTRDGFAALMQTHGASLLVVAAFRAWIPEDEDVNDPHDRGKIVRKWIDNFDSNQPVGKASVVALDDLELGYVANGIPHVQPESLVGLTRDLADRVVSLLGGA